MIRLLTSEEMDFLLSAIDREEHFLYYSYLTSRRPHTVHAGHFTQDGELLGVLAYCRGLPFHAFSVYPIQEAFQVKRVQRFLQECLELPGAAVGSCMVNTEVKDWLARQLEAASPPIPIMLMKHQSSVKLLPVDERVVRLEPESYHQIEPKLTEWNMMAFSKEELHNNPFYGVWAENELIAMGGFHIFSKEYVELGNIGTDEKWRKRGYGKMISAQLTRSGYTISDQVYLNVVENNTGAIRLYRSLGYETICHQHIVHFKL